MSRNDRRDLQMSQLCMDRDFQLCEFKVRAALTSCDVMGIRFYHHLCAIPRYAHAISSSNKPDDYSHDRHSREAHDPDSRSLRRELESKAISARRRMKRGGSRTFGSMVLDSHDIEDGGYLCDASTSTVDIGEMRWDVYIP